jgi:DNA-binding beta-propeller fold protein YncE
MGWSRAAVLILLAALAGGCSSHSGGSSGPQHSASSLAGSPAVTPGQAGGSGVVTRTQPGCSTSIQQAPALPASDVTLTRSGSAPFGVSVSADGRLAFLSTNAGVEKLKISQAGQVATAGTIRVPDEPVGNAIVDHGRYLLAADGAGGAEVVSLSAAEHGSRAAYLGDMTAPRPASGAIEVAATPDGHYAFVSLEDSSSVAVFNLARSLRHGFGRAGYVGSIPAQDAPVGLAVSPDGRWLYSTSEGESPGSEFGSLSVISVARAETDPAHSVVARVAAGCNPVRVITSADGSVVWVTARASDALLAFSAAALRTDPARALLADVPVGEAPVGLALVRDGSLVVVADSNRFGVQGAHASLAVVDVAAALAGRPAVLGYLPAGRFPREMAAAPGGTVLLVSDFGSGQVETVHLARLP